MTARYDVRPSSSCRMKPSARARSRDAISSKSCADTLPIARSNSSSLIARSASIFSRSRSARRRSLSGCPSGSTSAVVNGASMRYRANPAAPAAPMVRLISSRFSAEFCLARTTATLAATSDSSTKKCHGLNAPGASFLISVFGVTRVVNRGRGAHRPALPRARRSRRPVPPPSDQRRSIRRGATSETPWPRPPAPLTFRARTGTPTPGG